MAFTGIVEVCRDVRGPLVSTQSIAGPPCSLDKTARGHNPVENSRKPNVELDRCPRGPDSVRVWPVAMTRRPMMPKYGRSIRRRRNSTCRCRRPPHSPSKFWSFNPQRGGVPPNSRRLSIFGGRLTGGFRTADPHARPSHFFPGPGSARMPRNGACSTGGSCIDRPTAPAMTLGSRPASGRPRVFEGPPYQLPPPPVGHPKLHRHIDEPKCSVMPVRVECAAPLSVSF